MCRLARRIVPALHVLSVVAVCACARGGAAPDSIAPDGRSVSSPSGRWDGIARVPGSTPLRLTITLDSADGAWRGSLLVPAMDSQPVPFASILRVRDSVILRLNASHQGDVLRGHLSASGRLLGGIVETGDSGVTFAAAREGTADARALIAEVTRVDASRLLAARMEDSAAADSSVAAPYTDPDSAKLITSDVQRFWNAVDHAPPDSLATFLQREYLDPGTVGVRDFIRRSIVSAEDLAAYVRGHRARYDSARAANFDIKQAEPGIRAAFRRLKAVYPAAVYPDVYFVIGRFNSGGASSRHGLMIGAEMYRDPSRLPAIVAHELIHFQQHYGGPTLLENAFNEGSADFVGELISGAQINTAAYTYGMAHEHELWQEFTPHFDDRTFYPWMYGRPPDGRPNDLGYFIGYRIAQAYYNRMTDKQQAVHDIITANGGDVKALLARSGYNP